MMNILHGMGDQLFGIIFSEYNNDIELWKAYSLDHLYEQLKDQHLNSIKTENENINNASNFDDIWGVSIIHKYLIF